jgi:16S rRNA (uracil1498-N3)-methyltransferase
MVAEMSERYYISSPLAPGPVELTGPEAHHLATVCRLRPDDAVCLFNGDGRQYPALVRRVAKKSVLLDIVGIEAPERELPFQLEVAAPLPKGDRGPFLVEKLTELGATAFVPLACTRSVVHPRDGKIDRLQRQVVEASKQCGRNVLMRVDDLAEWTTYCRGGNDGELRLLAHPGETQSAAKLCATPQAVVRVAVGPEGGFTDDEVALARAVGWCLVGLGPRVLRVETAAIVLAAQAIAVQNGRYNSGAGPG